MNAFVPLAVQPQKHKVSSALERGHATRLHETAELIFDGDYCGVSDPLPEGTSKEAALAFLMQDSTRDLLFSAGGERRLELLNSTSELLEMWEDSIEYFGYERKPTEKDTLLSVEAIVQFPGLKLITTAASGIYTLTNEQTAMEEYHTFSVAEKQRTEGLKPAVWLFNQLTGNADKEKGVFLPASGRAKSIISLVENTTAVDDNETENGPSRFSFSFDVGLQVSVKFPKALMRIIPSSKEKMEEQGGTAIKKTVQNDVNKALQATVEAFVASVES